MRFLPDSYYSTLAAAHSESPFLSPVKSSHYVNDVAMWLQAAGGDTVLAEVGPGYGEIAVRISMLLERHSIFWAIDICPEFLAHVARRWDGHPSQLRTLTLDITQTPPQEVCLLRRRVDRLVAINVVQDTDLLTTLTLFSRWLRPGGYLWVTILAKETMDLYYSQHPLYDKTQGWYYKPATAGVQLGKRSTGRGDIGYDRILRFYTQGEAQDALALSNYVIMRQRNIAFPASIMSSRWKEMGTREFFRDGIVEALECAGTYVDSYEFVAQCIIA